MKFENWGLGGEGRDPDAGLPEPPDPDGRPARDPLRPPGYAAWPPGWEPEPRAVKTKTLTSDRYGMRAEVAMLPGEAGRQEAEEGVRVALSELLAMMARHGLVPRPGARLVVSLEVEAVPGEAGEIWASVPPEVKTIVMPTEWRSGFE